MNCREQVCLSDLCQTYLSARKFRLINIMGLKASNFRMNMIITKSRLVSIRKKEKKSVNSKNSKKGENMRNI